MILDLELVLWVILPLVLATLLAMGSLHCMRRDRRTVQYCIGIPTLLLMSVSILVLVSMLQPMTWPNFLPHIAIGICFPAVCVQSLLARNVTRKTAHAADNKGC